MRFTRQTSMRAATSAVLAGLGLLVIGCDERAADRKAISQFDKGDWVAAANEKGASPAIVALASGRATDEQLAKALPTYRDVAAHQVMIADAMWYLSRLATSAGEISASSVSLAKYDPAAALASIDKTVKDVNGNGAQSWSPAGLGVEMPTIAFLTNRSNQLKDQIVEVQGKLAELKKQQQGLADNSVKLLDESKAAQGEKSVELFRQSADARKQSSDVNVQANQAEAALVPLQQELAVVQDQMQIAGQALNVMTGHRETIDKSWRGILAQADERTKYVGAMFVRLSNERSDNIITQAARLAVLVAEQDKLSALYEQQLQEASTSAKAAVGSSEKALREAESEQIKTSVPPTAAANPNELFKLALDPSTARFTEGHVQFALGTHQAGRAAQLSSRARAITGVAEIAKQIQQKLPEGLDPTPIKAESEKIADQASENLKSAEQLFVTVSEAPRAASYTKRAATIGQKVTLEASASLASTRGDAATAKGYLDKAKDLNDKLTGGAQAPGNIERQ